MQAVMTGLGSCGIATGGLAVQQRFRELLGPEDEGVTLKETGCIGLCHREVLVEIDEHVFTIRRLQIHDLVHVPLRTKVLRAYLIQPL